MTEPATCRWFISAAGCDATTDVVLTLTEAEVIAVRKLAGALNAISTYSCMPTLEVRAATQSDEQRYAEDTQDAAETAAERDAT